VMLKKVRAFRSGVDRLCFGLLRLRMFCWFVLKIEVLKNGSNSITIVECMPGSLW
jgi:hypothetical protein